jgi:cobalt/nickel transport protein
MLCSLIALCAHLHTVIPEEAFLRKGRTVSIRYFYGHPFEHEVIAAKRPDRLYVVSPDGTKEDLLPAVKADGKGFRLTFTPKERGDHYLVLHAPPVVEDDLVYRESAKVILHVQSQRGWETSVLRDGLDIVPLTRPYGLYGGSVLRARVLWNGKPLARARVAVEKYNAAPPKELPEDPFITAVVLTDEAGTFIASLPEAGWWALTAEVAGLPERREGNELNVKHVLTFWLPVGRL